MDPKDKAFSEAAENFRKKEEAIEGNKEPIVIPEEQSIPNTNISPSEPILPSSSNLNHQGDIAKGYNPNLGQPKNDLEKPLPPTPEPPPKYNVPSENPRNPREGAPDIDKDYGNTLGNPGTNPVPAQPYVTPQNQQRESLPKEGLNKGNQLEENPNSQLKDSQSKNAKEMNNPENKNPSQDEQQPGNQSLAPKQENEQNPEAPSTPKDNKAPNDESQSLNKHGMDKPSGPPSNDSTERARRNLDLNNKVNQDRQVAKGKKPTTPNQPRQNNKNSGINGSSGLGGLASRLKNSITNGLNKKKSETSVGNGDDKGNKKMSNSIKGGIKKKILTFLSTHPHIVIIIFLIIFILLSMVADNLEGGSSSSKGKKGTKCTYNLKGVTKSGTVELSGLQVELINCDGTASNYTVLETVDFEKYVLGVALAEIGPYSPDESIKTQIIAARNFALTRNSGMCPSNPDNCFYGYNVNTGKIRMRACEADQVYWDYEKDIYRQNRGSISIYSPEINSGTLWKSALNETRKQEVLALANEVKGEVLVDSTDTVVPTPYVASVSEQFISLANQGKKYDQILTTVYTSSKRLLSASCTSYGNIDYGDYVLSTEGSEILHQPLDSFLSSKGTSLEDFNALISSNVEKAGYGTRAGVVAAAVTLIAELSNNYGVKVPYYWGGGHGDGVNIGAQSYWGSTSCHTYANGTSYNYCGLDCSGFVPWAIKNGGFNMNVNLAGRFQNLPGAKRVTLTNKPVLEPGDLLESSGHIVLVVGVDEAANSYICAEASGHQTGVIFSRRSYTPSNYWGVKMDGYYEANVRS